MGIVPEVPDGLTNVNAIAAGLHHTAVIVGHRSPPPTLNARTMGDELILSWPTNAVGFKLQSTLDLMPPTIWLDLSNAPALPGGQWTVTNTASGSGLFYRLGRQ